MFARSRLTCLSVLFLVVLTACGGGAKEAAPQPTPNRIPIAAAGADQTGNKGALISLSGSASTDPDGDALAYRWAQSSGPTVSLSSASAASPSFTAPAQSAVLVFGLTVNDGKADSAVDTVQVTIGNRMPVANAGADAIADTGVLYTLNGSSSSDPDSDPLAFEWIQVSGPAVALTAVSPGLARFSTPATATQLEFVLTVSDGEARSAQDTVIINVQNRASNNAPIAVTYGDFSMPRRSLVALDGYGYDPEGRPVTYAWTQVSGTPVMLTGAATAQAMFTAPSGTGPLEFELRVNDGVLSSLPARVVVTIENSAPNLYSSGITPDAPRTADTLSIEVDAQDGDNDPVTVAYVWRRNGVVVPSATGNSYPASLTTRGDVIALAVTASDGTASSSLDFSVAIGDTPPTLIASAPATANYGDNVSFTVTASDVDGDATGPYVLLHGPAGFTVSGAGAGAWQVSGPMFERTMDFNWGIGLRDWPEAITSGTIRVSDAARQQPLMRSGVVVPQQREQLVVADLDGNGVSEILLSNSRMLAAMNRSGSGWVQTWVSPFQLASSTEASIDAIAVAEVTGDTYKEIFVATSGRILQLGGADKRVRRQYDLIGADAHCAALRVADLDGNGSRELVCRRVDAYYGATGSTLLVLDASELSLNWNVAVSVGGNSLAVGNVDPDPALEIVLGEGYVFDGATHANEWLYGPGFGAVVDVGDFDANGIAEIAGGDTWSLVKVFSAVARSPITEVNTAGYGIGDVRTADMDGNGTAELLVGDNQWGDVRVYGFNPVTRQFSLTTSINSQDHGVSALAVGNTDADAALEVVWGTGVSSSGQDVLVVSQFAGGALLLDWSSEEAGQIDGPYVGGYLAQLAPSTRRLMFLSPRSQSGYGGSVLLTLDPVTGAVAQSPQVATNWSGISTLDVADYDGDGVDEGFLATANLYDDFLATYDFAAASVEWQSPLRYAQGVASAHADYTGDGAADFVVMGGDGKISVVDPLHSTSVWQSTTLNGGGIDIAAADLNQDGRTEIVALTGSYLYVYGSPSVGAPFSESGNVAISSAIDLLVANIEGDSRPEILVLAGNSLGIGQELRIYGYDLQPIRTIAMQVPASTLAVEPGSGGRRNILVGSGAPYYYYSEPPDSEVRAIDGTSGALVWKSPAVPAMFSKNSLRTVDVDGNGVVEIVYGTNSGMSITR
jgi:hypothetical protein